MFQTAKWTEDLHTVFVCAALAFFGGYVLINLSVAYVLFGTPWFQAWAPSPLVEGALSGVFPFMENLTFAMVDAREAVVAFFDLNRIDVYRVVEWVVIGAVMEEAVFRGPLCLLIRYADHLWWKAAAMSSAILFVALHSADPGIGSLLAISGLSIAATMSLGITRCVWAPFAVHILYNTMVWMPTAYQGVSALTYGS